MLKRAAAQFAGLLLGAACAWALTPDALAAVFSPTRVTWDATACPEGVYVVRATASNYSTGETFATTDGPFRLPQDTVTQEFANLPPGYYAVRAEAIRSNGETFDSSVLTVEGTGTPSLGLGRRGAAANGPTTSNRGHRSAAPIVTPAEPGGDDIRRPATAAAGSTRTVQSPPAAGGSQTGRASGFAVAHLTAEEPTRLLLRALGAESLLDDQDASPTLTIIDLDEDGIADFVAVEWPTGGLLIWSLRSP